MGGGLWSVMTVVGPILLGLVLLYALLRNRQRSARQRAVTEQATRDLQEQLNREDNVENARR